MCQAEILTQHQFCALCHGVGVEEITQPELAEQPEILRLKWENRKLVKHIHKHDDYVHNIAEVVFLYKLTNQAWTSHPIALKQFLT